MTKEGSLLLKDQISSYFERIRNGADDQSNNAFSAGSGTTALKGSFHAASTTIEKTFLFPSQLCTTRNNHHADSSPHTTPPIPMTVEEEKASSAARCLAILGATSAATKSSPTEEELSISRQRREDELMKKYQDIKRIEEEEKNRRPLVWDKPTFCPFGGGGETKSDESEEETSTLSNKKRKERDGDDNGESSSSETTDKCCYPLRKCNSSSSIDSCSNLLCETSNSRNTHTNLFPYGMLSGPSSATNGIEWSKEKVDSFVKFTDKWILPPKKKCKVDEEVTTTSTSP